MSRRGLDSFFNPKLPDEMEPNAVTAPEVPPSRTDTQEVPAAQPHPQEDKIAKDML